MIKRIEPFILVYEGINEERDALAVKAFAEHPMEVVLVRIETDDGYIGIGESLAYGCSETVKTLIERTLSPLIIGEDEEYIEKIWGKLYSASLRYGRRGIAIAGISGIDIALWDIMGKKARKPVFKLLGASKDRVNSYVTGGYYSPRKDIERLIEEVSYYVKMGFKGVKVKVGGLTVEEDIKRLKSVRDALGEKVRIAVDANNVYTFNEALTVGKQLEKLGIWFFEEPIQTDFIDLSAELVKELEVPIAGYETAFTRWEFYEIMRKRAVDIVQPDCMWSGGISEVIKIGALAKTLGIQVIPHYSASGVSLVANAHVAASIGCEWIETHLRRNDLRDNIFKEKIEYEDGKIVLPNRPGLGFTLRENIEQEYGIKGK
jgi:D-arabinonate dehydratase